jgi:filamentous hemagglutinin family protein
MHEKVYREKYRLYAGTVLRGSGALAFGLTALLSAPATANPQGGVIGAGAAMIQGQGTPVVQVTQVSDRAVIDWKSFNIAPGETTRFTQPSASSAILNRIHDQNPSQILGSLTANGQVALVNPNGMVFGKGSKVNVGSLIATTADIKSGDFMAGRMDFALPGKPNGSVVNAGRITAKDAGLVGLVAPNVANDGTITARLGKVALASGNTMTMDLYGDGLVSAAVSGDVASQLVENSGQIAAQGGTVALTAAAAREVVDSLIVNTGVIDATALGVHQGTIMLSAEGSNAIAGNVAAEKGTKQGSSTVLVRGVLDASGRNPGERGGKITVTGDNVALLDGTLIDASGYEGKSGTTTGKAVSAVRDGSAGGDIRIGGDYLGQGDTPTAKNLYVTPRALVLNDALYAGDAGRTIFWSDGNTAFHGNVYARALGGQPVGGPTWNAAPGGNAGDGGFVETSGHGHLDASGYVDLTASSGKRGTYFLDPADIAIYGNVDPAFQSTDGSINLSTNLKLWLDGSDTSKVTLTYNSLGTTATGTSGANTITVSATTGLVVGARIRLGGAGAVTTASTLGADTYTISAIAGTTITLSSNLTANYVGSGVYQGYVSTLSDKSSSANNATQATAASMPLWISNGQNGLGVAKFNGSNVLSVVDSASLSVSDFSLFVGMEQLVTQDNYLIAKAGGGASTKEYAFYLSANTFSPYVFNMAGVGSTPAAASFSNAASYWMGQIYNSGTDSAYLNGVLASSSSPGITITDTSTAIEIGNRLGSAPYNGLVYDITLYNTSLGTAPRNLLDQYESAKWGIALTPPGTGATEVAKATASDGYSVFTTRYLERLSQSANISLQATNNISLDFKGDTLNFSTAGRSLTLNAGNQITTTSAGTITTNNGNISLTGTNGILFNHAYTLNSGGGNITFNNATTLGAHLAANAGSGTLTFGSTVNGAYNLTGTAGTFSFASALGGTTPLSAVSLTSTNGLTLPSITAASVTAQTTGAAADITIPAGKALTASGSNTAITLASGRNLALN